VFPRYYRKDAVDRKDYSRRKPRPLGRGGGQLFGTFLIGPAAYTAPPYIKMAKSAYLMAVFSSGARPLCLFRRQSAKGPYQAGSLHIFQSGSSCRSSLGLTAKAFTMKLKLPCRLALQAREPQTHYADPSQRLLSCYVVSLRKSGSISRFKNKVKIILVGATLCN
jgi:hypothetical protein